MRKTLDRRGFLGAGAAATAGIAAVASRAHCEPIQSSPSQAGPSNAQDNTYKILKSIKEFDVFKPEPLSQTRGLIRRKLVNFYLEPPPQYHEL